MAVISKLNLGGKDITRFNNATISNINFNGVDYHFAKQNEVIGGYCENAVEEPIVDLKISGNSIQSKLPSEYQQVEFLESSGTQYIDTNYKLSANSNTELVISDLTMSPTSGGRIFGAWTTSTSNRYSFNLYSSTYLAMGYDNTSSAEAYTFTTQKTKLAGIGNKFYVDDVLIHEFASSSFKTEYSAYIAGNYTIYFKELVSTGNYIHRYTSNNSNTWLGRINLTRNGNVSKFTLDRNCYVRFTIQPINTSGSLVLNTQTLKQYEPQLEKGDIATDYEPYGYKVPIKVSGKNLLNPQNIAGLVSQGGTDSAYMASSTEYKGLILKCKPNTKYTLAQSFSTGRFRTFLYNEYPSSSSIRSTSGWIYDSILQRTFTTGANTQYLGISLGLNENFTSDYKIWLIEGDYIDYEPYVEPTITNIYLKEPLRKIGDYADYLDYKNKKVVRNITSEYIDSVGNVSGDIGTYKKFLSGIKHKPLLSGSGTTATGFAISNKFNRSIYNYTDMTYHPNQIQTYITTAGANRIAYTFDDRSIITIQQAQPLIGDGFEICYVMADTIEEPIDIPEISTNDGTNIFGVETSVEPSELSVDYWKQI